MAKNNTVSNTQSSDTTTDRREAKRRSEHERKARIHQWASDCFNTLVVEQGKAGDVIQVQNPVIKGHKDWVVVVYAPDFVTGLTRGAGLIVRNAHPDSGDYSAAKSKTLATKLGKLLGSIAAPAPQGVNIGGPEAKEKIPGGMLDTRPHATWMHFEFPEIDDDGEVIPLAPFREKQAPKAPKESTEAAKKSAKTAKEKAKSKSAKGKGKAPKAKKGEGKAAKAAPKAKKSAAKPKAKAKGKAKKASGKRV